MSAITQTVGNVAAVTTKLGTVYGTVLDTLESSFGDVASVKNTGFKITKVSNINESCLDTNLKETINSKQNSLTFATEDDINSMF